MKVAFFTEGGYQGKVPKENDRDWETRLLTSSPLIISNPL